MVHVFRELVLFHSNVTKMIILRQHADVDVYT